MKQKGSCLEKEIIQGTVPGGREKRKTEDQLDG